jgi:molybdate transport system ATP-binding protein
MKAPAAIDAEFRLEVSDGAASSFRLEASFKLESGVLVFFGPSGAGKTLAVQALGGLIRPLDGRIEVRGRRLYSSADGLFVRSHRRRIGYVPQHDALFPFCKVFDNVAFGLPRAERRRDNPRLGDLLEELGIEHLSESTPSSLSGGERQRVALARALAVGPDLLLLDEPFASIDHRARKKLLDLLRRTLEHHQMPAVLVTHDIGEAEAIGDSVVRFQRGRTLGQVTAEGLELSQS